MNERAGFKLFYFLTFASFSGYVMFRNVYLQEIGMSGTQMGLVGFLFPLFTMIAQPVWGFVADWKAASKPILYVSAIVAGGAVLIYPLAPRLPATFLAIALATAIFAAFRAPALPIANALVLSTGMSYGGVRAYGSVAFGVVGLGIGYLIGTTTTALIFYAFSVGMVLVVALLCFLPVEEPGALDGDLDLAATRRLLDSRFLLLLLSAFCLGVMTPAGSAFFSVYVREIGLADSITGVAWLFKTIAEAIVFLVVARRGTGSYRRLMALGGVLYVGTYVLLSATGAVGIVVGAQFLIGFGYALFNLASVNLAHRIAPDALKSTAQSLLMVGGASAGAGVGEVVTGLLVDLVGVQQTYAYVAGLGLVVAAIALRIPKSRDRSAETGAGVPAE